MAGKIRDKFFDAINESYDALLTVIEGTEARGHRLSKAVIDEAREGEREVVALARKWVDAPTNVFENLQAMLDAQARAQRRGVEFASDVLDAAGEFGADVQDSIRRAISANAEATVEATREPYTRVRRGDGAEPAGRKQTRATRVPVSAGTSSGGAASS